MEDFLDMIEKNAVGSRAEPGCLRFDVLQSADADNKFIFYEVYEGELCLFYCIELCQHVLSSLNLHYKNPPTLKVLMILHIIKNSHIMLLG